MKTVPKNYSMESVLKTSDYYRILLSAQCPKHFFLKSSLVIVMISIAISSAQDGTDSDEDEEED